MYVNQASASDKIDFLKGRNKNFAFRFMLISCWNNTH